MVSGVDHSFNEGLFTPDGKDLPIIMGSIASLLAEVNILAVGGGKLYPIIQGGKHDQDPY